MQFLSRILLTKNDGRRPKSVLRRFRLIRGEPMEPRCLLSVTPIQVGAIYIEQDIGTDATGDTFLLSFDGGAAGTQLERVIISGDQVVAGFGVGDVFFDTTPGGFGADDAFEFTTNSTVGIDVVRATVNDGGLTLVLEFEGFDAGEKFVFSIDVDEVEDLDPLETNPAYLNDGIDPITSGVEFQSSLLTAEFSAPDFYDAESTASFRNRYDEALIASGLDLPADNAEGKQDRTAGAFAEIHQLFIPASISGYVYHDRNDNGLRQAGEEGLAGVELQIIPVLTVDDQSPLSVFTNSSGYYEANGLAAGQYRVIEVDQPVGYLDGLDTPGTIEGQTIGQALNPGDEITDIVLAGGDAGVAYNFGEVLAASIAGRVQLSTRDGDCFGENIFHEAVVGATVLLYGGDGNLVAETVSDANGEYFFGDLRPDTYTVVELTPPDLVDGGASPGTLDGQVAGVVGNDGSVTIDLTGGQSAEDVDFCEHEPATLEGKVYHDRNNNGRREDGDEGIAGVVIQLRDQQGQVVAETVTDVDGCYRFEGIEAGEYDIREVHPDDWIDGQDSAGLINGQRSGQADNPGDIIRGVEIGWGDEGVEFNFGEFLYASISGRVQLSTRDGDCFGESASHEGLADVRVMLLNASGDVIAETFTNADGYYQFVGLPPGTYSLVEETPTGLFDGGAQAGAIDGLTAGTAQDSNTIFGIDVTSGDEAVDNLFCEHKPATVDGKVYHDRNDNGVREAGEEGIAGVVIQLLDQDGNVIAETVTDKDGCYRFEDVPAGKYDIRQIHPAGWLDGTDSAGQVNGQTAGQPDNPGDIIRCVELSWGDTGTGFDFGELKPGVISGLVHSDIVRDCEFEPADGEAGLAGITVELLDANGHVIATTVTNQLGQYRFKNLAPAKYSVRQIQPDDYFDGGWNDGAERGDGNHIASIDVGSGQSIADQNFCEVPPSKISGYVFQDGDTIVLGSSEELPERLADVRDGKRTPDDTPLRGVTLELRDGISGRPIDGSTALPGTYRSGYISTITNGRGYYQFVGLPPGSYAVFQLQPPEYIDGVDTPGTTSGFVFNPGEPVNNVVLQALVVSPQNNAIVRISLPPGTTSTENNFSEVVIERQENVFPPELPPTKIPELPPPVWIDNPQFLAAPALPQYLVQSYGDGSDSPVGSNWHLSVIDGGQPRGEGLTITEPNNIWMAASKTNVSAAALRRGAWQIPRPYAQAEPGKDTVLFGLDGAIPFAADFNGDGFDEIGVFLRGQWFIDINANGEWDQEDLWARLGDKDDLPVTGDWDGDGKADIGIYGRAWVGDANAIMHEPGLPDSDNATRGKQKNLPPERERATSGHRVMQLSKQGRIRADLIDHVFNFGLQTDAPVVADWNGDGIATIGVFRQGKWHLDVDGDGKWLHDDHIYEFGQAGDIPLTGDFDGDGIDDLAVYRNGIVHIDSNGNRALDSNDKQIRLGRAGGHPVAGDWDGDGVDEIAIYHGIRGAAEAAAEPVERTAMRDAG